MEYWLPESYKKGVAETVFHRSPPKQVLLEIANFKKNKKVLKNTPTQVLSIEICEIFKNNFFYRIPAVARVVAPEISIIIIMRVEGEGR